MPHAVFDVGAQSGTVNVAARALIPGIEPGGSRAGQPTKPALLIRDAWIEIIDWSGLTTADFNAFTYYLKLSQETDLSPGLLLPVAMLGGQVLESDATARQNMGVGQMHQDLFKAQGTVWAPRMVGIRAVERGSLTVDVDVHLDYEMVEVPWMDWFIMWDFLDNVPDNDEEY